MGAADDTVELLPLKVPRGPIVKDPAKWNALDKWRFNWMNELVPYAREGKVGIEDLPLPHAQQAEVAYDEFAANWDQVCREAKAAGTPPKLMKALIKTYGSDLFKAGIFKLLWTGFLIMGAYFFTRSILLCIRTLEGKDKSPFDSEMKGWILTGGFFIDAWLLGIALQRMAYGCLMVGIKARAALNTAVARKCYSMSHLTKETAAEAVSFVATDINKIFEGMQEIHYLWGAPIEAAAILALLATLVGIYSLPGVAALCLVVPAQYYFGWRIIRNKVANFPNTSARYSIIQELLPAMKLVKYYAWERFFEEQATAARQRELKLIVRNAIIKTINVTMVFGVPPIVTFCVLVPYELRNEGPNGGVFITPQTAFTMLSLFNVLRFPLIMLPKALRCVSEAINAAGNIETFLAEPTHTRENKEGEPGVRFENAELKHNFTDSPFRLKLPQFSVRPGELVAVVGRVGAGKSSLLHAILGNMELVSGSGYAAGNIAYVPQTAWCQNLTLRDNILFGNDFDQNRYDNVIHACALELDLQILAQGDQSKAGLRGINLSGGQRQRLNLARAAYCGGDLILLDNALSAVDHHTAQHIFEHAVRGIFRDKATILVTHQVEFLPQCDKVAIMDGGDCVYFGPWCPDAATLLSKYLPASHLLAAAGNAEQPSEKKKPAAKKKTASNNTASAKTHSASLTLRQAMWEYACDARWIVFICSLFFFVTAQSSRQVADYFIRWWTRDHFGRYPAAGCKGPGCGGIFYVKWYAFFGLVLFISLMLFRGAFLYIWGLGSAQRTQSKAIHRVLYAPLGFFLTTPVGDLLVSFTKDQDVIDEALPDALYYTGIYGFILCATTVTVSVTIPMFGAMAGGLYLVSALMLLLYLPAATHLKKLRLNTSGDLVTLVAEALDGLGVIQAYGRESYFVQLTSQHVDDAHRALFAAESLNLWLAFFCDLYGAIMVLAVASFGISQWRTLGSSNVGLAFSQSIQMLVFYTGSIRLLADCIGLFGSSEKLSWLANHTPQEGGRLAPPALAGGLNRKAGKSSVGKSLPPPKSSLESEVAAANKLTHVPQGWPRTGDIQFEDVFMKYAPHLPPALRGVSFHIQSAEKVGVVGRTGSGKSTLLLALYRMFDLEIGKIIIDGIDISGLALTTLRRGLSVIPQEPVVFSGTVRSNLDPFGEFGSDAVLWQALRDCSLEQQVKTCGGLDGKLDGTGGQAWSIGQQQLMCLARAALKKVPILCLDEATAAMDPHTEAQVLEIIERIFSERTTLTIAHRLDSVIRSDQVIVMDAGRVAEIAAPSVLLANPDSAFSKLVDKTGAAGAAALRQMAAEFFEERRQANELKNRRRPSLDTLRRRSIEAMGAVPAAASVPRRDAFAPRGDDGMARGGAGAGAGQGQGQGHGPDDAPRF